MTPLFRKSGWLALVALLSTAPPAFGAESARVEVMVLELGRGDPPRIDPRIADDAQIIQSLGQYNRILVIERLDTRLEVGREVALEFSTPADEKAELHLSLLERTEQVMKLRVRCKALQDLDTTTTHKDGGTFLVVRPQSSVGVAIRRVREPS